MATLSRLPSLPLDFPATDAWFGVLGSSATHLASPPPLCGATWNLSPAPSAALTVDKLFALDSPMDRPTDGWSAPVLETRAEGFPPISELSQSCSSEAPSAPELLHKHEQKPAFTAGDEKIGVHQLPVLFARDMDSAAITEARNITASQTEEHINECRERSVQIRGTTGRRTGERASKGKKGGRYQDRLKLNQLYSSVARTRQKTYITNLEDVIAKLEKRSAEVASKLSKTRCENEIMQTAVYQMRRSAK